MNDQTVHVTRTRTQRVARIPNKLISATSVTLMSLLAISSVWADPGGGGGGLGGGGASGPEPSQWFLILIGAVILGGVAFYRARMQAKR